MTALEDADFGDDGDELGDVDFDFGALTFVARDVEVEIGAVENAQALADVAEADPFDVDVGHFFFGDANPVVFDLDVQAAIAVRRSHKDAAAFDLWSQAVFEAVFDDGLEQHAGDEGLERVFADFFHDVEVVFAEAGDFDVEVVVDERELFAKRDEGFVFAEETAKNVAELQNDAAGGVGVHADQSRDGVEGVEEEVRIDLAGEGVHAGAKEQLLMALEIHFDARVVPDFER
jgi:hypothetical protein